MKSLFSSFWSGATENADNDADKIDFTFQWATLIPIKPHESVKLFTVNSILRNNSRYYTNCLIYVKDKIQQEQFKLSIQKDAKLVTKCCSSNDLMNLSDQFSKAKIFVVSVDGNVTDNYHIPQCFDLVFFFSIPKLEDYEKLVRKQIKNQTKSKCGLVINYYSSPADEKMVDQFVEKTKVKANTHQQLMKQSINLSRYFKLEDISLEKKISEKSKQDIVKSPEVRDKISTQNLKTIKNIRNLNWATYLIISTEQQYKAGRTYNYIKLRPNQNCCIVYTKAESRAKFIFQRLPSQIQNQASILVNYPKNYLEYLQKLQEKQIRILIIVANNQDFQSHSSQFYVPNSVNLIISDNIPTRQTFNQRFGKIKQTNEGGVIVSFVSSYNENEEFRNYCKQNGIKINDQHRKDDYYLDKYIKPSLETLQEKLKKQVEADSSLNKNTENLIKIQQNKPSLNIAKNQTTEKQLGQSKTEKKQEKQENVQPLVFDKKIEVKHNSNDILGKEMIQSKPNDVQIQQKSKIEQKPNPQAEPEIEQANQNPYVPVQSNINKPTSTKIQPSIFQPSLTLKQDTNYSSNNPAQKQLMKFFNTLSTKQVQLSDKFDQLPKKIQQLDSNISERIQSVGSSIKQNTRIINQTTTARSQIISDSFATGIESLEHTITQSLSDQKSQLYKNLKSVTTCIETENQKNLAKISEIHHDTSQIKIIANEAKQIREALPCISGSILSIKQNITKDIKQLSKINLRVEDTQKSNSQSILTKIGEANQFNSKLIKETAGQYKRIIYSEFKNLNQKQAQIGNKLDQVPGKLQTIHNDTSAKLNELKSSMGKDLEQLLKSQSQNNNTIIKVQNRQIFNYIDAEKQKMAKRNENILQELKTKKQATETHQKNRIAQFERKLNDEEKFSRDAELYKKLKQLEKKYQQSMAEITTLRTFKVNGVKTSEELDRLKLELSQARKIEAKFNAYKKRYGIQTAIYNKKQKECDQLQNLIKSFQLQIQDLVPIRDELNTAKQTIYNFIQSKSQKKDPEGGSINKLLVQSATNTVNNNILMKSMAQISKIPKQAQNMNLPTLIKTYLFAQTRALSDLKPYLSNMVKGFPSKQSDSLLTESKQAKACMNSFENALKSVDKQSGSYQLLSSILRLIGQYDTLKKYQISISKYNRELQVTLRAMNDKIDQAAKKGIQLTPTKILDYNYKESVINVDLQEICKNVNRLLTNFNSKTAQLAKVNQLIEELKKQSSTQSTIITGLNADRNTLSAQLKQAKETILKLQTQLTQIKNDLSIMATNYKKTVADLEQTKKKWGQTSTKLTQTQTNLKKVTKTLQQKINQFEITLKQTTEQLSITKAALQQKQRQASAQKQQLTTNDSDLSKIRRALQDQKARAEERADEADKNIQDLRKTITEVTKNYKDLEQKSKRQIEDQRKKYQQQLQKKQEEMKINSEKVEQKLKLFEQMKLLLGDTGQK